MSLEHLNICILRIYFFSFYFFPEISPCFPNPCQNGGHCIRSGYSYTCSCVAGFTSDNCEDGMWYIERIKHSGRKGEREDLIIFKMQDFTHRHVYLSGGRDTEMEMTSLCLFYLSDINECDSDPCQNNGHCNNLRGSYQCACPSGYLGTNCQSGKF